MSLTKKAALVAAIFMLSFKVYAIDITAFHVTPDGEDWATYCSSISPAGGCTYYGDLQGSGYNCRAWCQSSQNNSWLASGCSLASGRKNINCVLPPGSQCPEGQILEGNTCVIDCASKAGQDAGIEENALSPPGYESKCYGGCAVTVSEYFQRLDNNNWVIAYIYTGQACGPGDPLEEPDLPPGEEGPESNTPPISPDTDSDGTPDNNDGDIDGDGIPNSTDPDKDGDGIPNEDDPTPGGPGDGQQKDEPSNASTSDDCLQRPSCSGDAIECAQLMEIWRLRCKSANNTIDWDEGEAQDIVQGVNDQNDTLLNEYETSTIDTLDNHNQITFNDSLKDKVLDIFPDLTCTDLVIALPENPATITCSQTSMIRVAVLFIFSIFTIVSLWHIATKPVEK